MSKSEESDPRLISMEAHGIGFLGSYARHREYGYVPHAQVEVEHTWLASFWRMIKHGLYALFHAHTPAEPDYFDVFPLRNRLYTSGGQSGIALLNLMKTIEEQLPQDDAENSDFEQPQTRYPDVPPCPRGTTWLHLVNPLSWIMPHRTYEEMRDDIERLNGSRPDFLPPMNSESEW